MLKYPKDTIVTILNPLSRSIRYQVSRMANYASMPKHEPTTKMWQYGQGNTPLQLKIASWNVNGIRSVLKKQALQDYLLQSDPDIICINETKMCLDAYQKNKKQMEQAMLKTIKAKATSNKENHVLGDWFAYWNFCKVSSGYSGVLTLSKYKPIKSIQDFKMDHYMSLQGRCLTLQFQKFYIINVYKPNSGSKLERLEQRTQIYDKNFMQFINQLKKTKPVIVCGDMNVAHNEIDLARPKANVKNAGFTKQQRQAFSNLLKQGGMIDCYRYLHPNKVEYTWWSTRLNAREANIGWRIDYILSSDAKFIKQAKIRADIMGSDHCPVQCKIKL